MLTSSIFLGLAVHIFFKWVKDCRIYINIFDWMLNNLVNSSVSTNNKEVISFIKPIHVKTKFICLLKKLLKTDWTICNRCINLFLSPEILF